jgi:putative hydrolase of the HAD superfamily
MQYRAIIFDLYGVLGLNGWQEFKRQHFAERRELWEQLRSLGQRVDAGQASEEEFVEAVALASGETGDEVRYQFEHTLLNTELLDFIEKQLKGKVKLGLLSNASHDVLGGIFTHTQLVLFDATVSSYRVGLTKPDPKMFMLMCNELGVRPEECIMVDDQERHIAAAKALGFHTILYESPAQAKQAIEEATV